LNAGVVLLKAKSGASGQAEVGAMLLSHRATAAAAAAV
jgi:hypothetical protein